MVPYAILFYAARNLKLERYENIGRDWLRLLKEKGEPLPRWAMYIKDAALNPEKVCYSHYCRELENERSALSGELDRYEYGFVWKMYLEYGLTAQEICKGYNEPYEFSAKSEAFRELARSCDERVLGYCHYLLDADKELFERDVWNKLPEDERELFKREWKPPVPYAALFDVSGTLALKRYKGIGREWLRMLEERGETPPHWARYLEDETADHKSAAFTDFCLRREEEESYLHEDYLNWRYVNGFTWKMYLDYGLTAEEIYKSYGYDECSSEPNVFRELARSGDERVLDFCHHLFDGDKELFEKDVWYKVPEDIRELFKRKQKPEIPYAALFYTVYFSRIGRYRGIWQDWLRMTAEKGEVPEPWAVCLAEDDFHGLADGAFRARYEREREFLSYGAEEFVPGFVWKMFEDDGITADETFFLIEHCGSTESEEAADKLRLLAEEGDDERFYACGSGMFGRKKEIFEKEIWIWLPEDVRELFKKRGAPCQE